MATSETATATVQGKGEPTAGEWYVQRWGDGSVSVEAPGAVTVFRVNSEGSETLPNAHLGATAKDMRDALRDLVEAHDFSALDRGIGTATPEGKRWLAARAAVAKAEVR